MREQVQNFIGTIYSETFRSRSAPNALRGELFCASDTGESQYKPTTLSVS